MKNSLINLLIGVVIIIIINAFSSSNFARFDLTSEKRYTLSPATLKMIENLDDIVYFRVYLEGNLPPGIKRLRNQTRELLDELKAYSDNIMYDFVNPNQTTDRDALFDMLVSKGLQPTQVQRRADDATSQQLLFPGAIVTYRDYEAPLNLLVSQAAYQHHEEALLKSSQALEYNIANVIRQLTTSKRSKVGFVTGQGELENYQLSGAADLLVDHFDVTRVNLNNNLKELLEYKVIVIAKPQKPFDEKQKFLLDQYLMNGGKMLMLVDPVFASMDSLMPPATQTIGLETSINLGDILFKYGVRLNPVLVKDLRAAELAMITGMIGDSPQYSLVPWPFFPLLEPASNHEIVRNLNLVAGEFSSTIDTILTPRIHKTPLLRTSPSTKVVNSPVIVSFDFLKEPLDEQNYNAGQKNVAYLLEGTFESVFRNRPNPGVEIPEGINFLDGSQETAIIVVADGDIVKNKVDPRGNPLPLGYDTNTGFTYGNGDFLVNCINYLADDSGIIQARAKDFKIRLLDRAKAGQYRSLIQMANILLPLALLIILGILRFIWRRKRYSKD